MNIGSYLQFGNMLKGAYDANQQALINQQNQQRINDLLANDALTRHLLNQQVTGGGEGLSALAAIGQTNAPSAPIGTSQTAPAPPPGGSSQPSPVATPIPVQMPGAATTQQPQAAPPAPFNPYQIDPATQAKRDRYALSMMQQELQTNQQVLQAPASPQQAQLAQGNIAALKREMDRMSQRIARETPGGGTPDATSPMVTGVPALATGTPAIGAPPQPDTSTSLEKGVVGKSLALAQNNMPIAMLQKFVQQFKTMYPNATPGQLYWAAQAANPTLVDQANSATKLAGMSIDSLFKGLTTSAELMNAQSGQIRAQNARNLLPSQIAANNARAQEAQILARLYGQGVGGGTPSSPGGGNAGNGGSGVPEGQQPSYDLALAYLNGTMGSTSGPLGAARQNQAFQQLVAIGLPPSAEKPYQNDLMAARSAQTQLSQRATTLQATSGALDTQLNQAIADAKQLNLNGPVVWNGGKLYVGNKVIPTSSPVYQVFQHYDALVADASREAGAQQMFGKATVAGLKNGAQIVAANKGEGLLGVLQGLKDGAQASVDALNHTIAATQVMPTLRLISRSSKPQAAAQAFGFTPISMSQLKAYAKQYKITDDQAAMSLSTQPNQPYYVIGYPYGQ